MWSIYTVSIEQQILSTNHFPPINKNPFAETFASW